MKLTFSPVRSALCLAVLVVAPLAQGQTAKPIVWHPWSNEVFAQAAREHLSPNGSVIVKRQGYLPVKQVALILEAVLDDPSPGPSVEPEKTTTYATNPFSRPLSLQDCCSSRH